MIYYTQIIWDEVAFSRKVIGKAVTISIAPTVVKALIQVPKVCYIEVPLYTCTVKPVYVVTSIIQSPLKSSHQISFKVTSGHLCNLVTIICPKVTRFYCTSYNKHQHVPLYKDTTTAKNRHFLTLI